MAYNYPTIQDFKNFFPRQWPYTNDVTTGVTDADIGNAMSTAMIMFNGALWPNQNSFTVAFLYLTANYLVLNLRAASAGISGGMGWIEQSKSVQGVSQTFAVPMSITNNPFFALLTRTAFGGMYFEMIYPHLAGNSAGVVAGTTQMDGRFPGAGYPYGYGCGGTNGGF